jgi:hypothetical protein
VSLRTRPRFTSRAGAWGVPVKILGCGSSVILDAEDLLYVDRWSWHLFTLSPSMKTTASRKEVRFGREYRVMLHREIAVRMRPDLIEKKRRFVVKPINGDYLDCRRENLNVVVRVASRRGAKGVEPRPKGYRVKRIRGKSWSRSLSGPPASPLWAGGYDYREIDATHVGRGRRLRRCINGKPVD